MDCGFFVPVARYQATNLKSDVRTTVGGYPQEYHVAKYQELTAVNALRQPAEFPIRISNSLIPNFLFRMTNSRAHLSLA